jgi:hypothetical protein
MYFGNFLSISSRILVDKFRSESIGVGQEIYGWIPKPNPVRFQHTRRSNLEDGKQARSELEFMRNFLSRLNNVQIISSMSIQYAQHLKASFSQSWLMLRNLNRFYNFVCLTYGYT